MKLACRVFHRRWHEELLEHKQVQKYTSKYNWDYIWKWVKFTHCTKCHEPLLDPEKEYITPEEMESKVRAHMLDESLKRPV